MRIWIAAAAALVFALAFAAFLKLQPASTKGTLQTNPPTPYIHIYPTSGPNARVLVVHGLDSSKNTMQLISAALADGGFEVYNIDLPGHGDSQVGFEAGLARETLRRVVEEIQPNIVLGHSLGVGFLLDLSADQHFSTMVLLSAPPTPILRPADL